MTRFTLWMIESSLMILMIYAIRKIFMGKVRYAVISALWLVVFVRLFVPLPIGNIPFSVGNLAAKAGWMIEETVPGADTKVEVPVAGNAGISRKTMSLSPAGVPSQESTAVQKPEQLPQAHTEMSAQIGDEKHTFSMERKKLAAVFETNCWKIIWSITTAVLLCWFFFLNQRQKRRLRRHRVLCGQEKRVSIYRSEGVKSPCLYGLFRPAIYLPEQTKEMPKQDVEKMILHEYVHYRHLDHIWSVLRILLLAVYWFHPLVWLAVLTSRKDAELFCDEKVLELLGEEERIAYGKVLVSMAAKQSLRELCYPAVPMSRKGREMKRRILAITHPKSYSRWLLLPVVAAVVLVCGFTGGKSVTAKTQEKVAASVKVVSDAKNTATIQKAPAILMAGIPMDLRYQNMGFLERPVGNAAISDQDIRECKQIFHTYINTFIHSVNTGNTDGMSYVLKPDSNIYTEQTALAVNYYSRGIRENIDLAIVTDAMAIDEKQIQVQSSEKIRVSSSRSNARLVNQSYCYTCERVGGKWMITDMTPVIF